MLVGIGLGAANAVVHVHGEQGAAAHGMQHEQQGYGVAPADEPNHYRALLSQGAGGGVQAFCEAP